MKILAYGSLMSSASLRRALGREADLERVIVPGYARIFNVPFFDFSYLNLVKKPGSAIEAAYFEIDESELKNFAGREAGSDLVEVLPDIYAFIWPESASEEGSVLQSYIDFVSSAAEELAINLNNGWLKPKNVIDDLEEPKYPDMGQ